MKRYLYFACTIMLATLIASEGAVTGRAQASNDPELPRVLLDTTMPDTSGWLVKTVKASGGNYPLTVAGMQQAIDDAAANTSASGIIIKIDPTDLVASLVLKRQAVDNRFIFIRSSSPVFDAGGAVPPGKRVSPAYASEMVTLRANTGGSTSVIRTEFVDGSKGASFYRVIGIRATVTNTLSAVLTAPIRLGDVSAAQNQLAEIASDLIIDRCYIHGSPLAHVTRGVYINSARTAVIDSHIEEIHGVGQDTQAIISINTPGPLKIVNNYMEAAGENYLSGGADPAVQGLVTEDIEFRRNYMTKKLRWKSAIIPAPAGVVATAQAGGALEADKTYTYKVVALGPVGATTAVGDPSAAAQATTTATDRQVEISLSRVQYPTDERNATSYRIYVSADGGATWLGYFTHIPADPSAATHTVIHDGAQTLTSGSPAAVGTRWTVKNVFELKYGRRVLVEANILEYSWKPDQDGYGFLIKTANQDGGVNGNWAVTEDVTIRHNKVIHVGIGIAISHKATPDLLDGTKRVRVENNLFYDISTDWTATSTPATASCIAIGGAPPDVQFIHNTIAQANDKGGYMLRALDCGNACERFVFRDNVVRFEGNTSFCARGTGATDGDQTLAVYFPGADFSYNVVSKAIGSHFTNQGPTNEFPADESGIGFTDFMNDDYRLTAGSRYSATGAAPSSDGKGRGVDFSILDAQLSGVTTGTTEESDTTPPAISNVSASNVTDSGATVTWDTNEAADTQVEYGTSPGDYTAVTTRDQALVTSHTVLLSQLAPGTTYYYRARSADAAGNLRLSAEFSFATWAAPDTTPPVISGVTAANITSGEATITWVTDEASDTQVEYGTTSGYGSSTPLDPAQVANHSATLSGLAANTLYHYRVLSRDAAGNLSASEDFTFTTSSPPDTTPPAISKVAAINITRTGATITWTTNETSDSQVEYGQTTAYGSMTPVNSSLVKNHRVTLTGLSPSTVYNYRVKSRDAAGNLSVAGNFTFRTKR